VITTITQDECETLIKISLGGKNSISMGVGQWTQQKKYNKGMERENNRKVNGTMGKHLEGGEKDMNEGINFTPTGRIRGGEESHWG